MATPTTKKAKPVSNADAELNAQKNKLRNEAEAELRDKYREELNQLTESKFKAAGLTYNRRLTKPEQAAKKIELLLQEHPELRNQYASLGPLANAQVAGEVSVMDSGPVQVPQQ